MNELAIAIFGILVGLVILYAFPAVAFVSSLRSSSRRTRQDDQFPKVAIILCVRGADPFLANCIRSLLNQNYPQYSLQIVVDSYEDPAWKIVNDASQQSQGTQVQIKPLINRYKTCSLKCSALVQAISELDDSYDVVALVDADVIAYSDWLRELVLPLADEGIGATTGHRWYMPQTARWGSLVRYLWNSSSVAPATTYQSLWGGSMALKLSVLRKSRLLETWTQVVSSDVPVRRELQKMGLKVKFVPTVMMVNREECDFAKCLRFVTRQILVTRLYHPSWRLMSSQIFTTTFAFVMAVALLPIALVTNYFDAAAWLAGGLVSYILGMALLLAFLDREVRQVVRARGEPTQRFSILVMAKILVAIPLTQLIYPAITVSAILARSVEWRGITYQFEGPSKIRLIEYQPYKPSSQLLHINGSI